MLTYVINTSENKTFESSLLFDLTGYNKIRWLHCSLHEVEKCAAVICERQNILGADRFRIAVIVDFFGFDQIRKPYGRRGYTPDNGVDICLYMPYIEAYLQDNLTVYLENRDLLSESLDIYYVQSETSENYDLFDNAKSQLAKVMQGIELPSVANGCPCGEQTADENATGENTPTEEATAEEASAEEASAEEASAEEASAEEASAEEASAEEASAEEASAEEASAEEASAEEASAEEASAEEASAEQTSAEQTAENKTATDKKAVPAKNKGPKYSAFRLYCTPTVSLDFRLQDYPYGDERLCFDDFWEAFRHRSTTHKPQLRRHYYLTTYGGGASRAALDTLSLSLYLIRTFEREEEITSEGNMEVLHLDSSVLREVLETSWSKVNAAKGIAKKNHMTYYALEQTTLAEEPELPPEEKLEYAIDRERDALPQSIKQTTLSAEGLYQEISDYASRTPGDIERRYSQEFNQIMGTYLRKRDETRAADIEAEFQSLKSGGFLKETDQCPSREEYEHTVDKKQKEISGLFERALSAGYIEVNYTEEKKAADEAYVAYKKAAACLQRNLIGDIVFLLLAVAAMIVPYGVLQLSAWNIGTISATTLGLLASAAFGGVFILSVLFQIIPQARRLKKARRRLQKCYISCCAKERYSFSAIRRRYERDLIDIEQARYEIRQIKSLYAANVEKDKNVTMHHEMLERLEDCLSSILNNLDVEPVVGLPESVEDEFDMSKPFRARENKVYQIFSIETIEKMFPKKGSDER